MSGLVNIGLTGLRAHQLALSVTGNNVANTNTPGYTRQEAVFVDNLSLRTGAGYVGQGVSVETIRRISQNFVVEQVRADTSVYSEREAALKQAESVDNLLASSTTGLTPALSRFFQAFQGAAEDPTSVPQRQLLLTQTEGLVSRFHALNGRLNAQMENIDQELQAAVAEVNSIAQSLAKLNQSIAVAVGAGQGDMPNKLLDERDEALRRLSELVTVSTTTGADARMNVFIGKGQPLVVGNSAAQLSTQASAQEGRKLDIMIQGIGSAANQLATNELTGGKIGGLIQFRDQDLTPAINGLGRVAIAIADTINHQHSLGLDLENNMGGLFFNDVNDRTLARNRVIANGNNTPPTNQVLRVEITDPKKLSTHDYEVRFEGPGNDSFTIVRVHDGSIATRGTLQGVFPATVDLDGFRLYFESGTFKQGDKFTLLPTRAGAAAIAKEVDRVEELAFASPIRAQAGIGNTGTAKISLGEMLDTTNPLTNQPIGLFANPGRLTPNLGIQFITNTVYEIVDISNPANPVPLNPPMNNLRYIAGASNNLFSTDPGETLVSAQGPDMLSLPAPVATPGPYVNGYSAQTLNFLSRNPSTGVVTPTTVNLAANASAKEMASAITAVSGASANAYTQVRLSNFVDNGDATPLGIEINGETLTISPPAVFGPDALASVINANTTLQSQNIVAVSDGVSLTLRATTGENINVVVTGSGDSVDVSKLDPYSPGTPVLSTQTVGSGQGLSVGGFIDVRMSEGVSFTSPSVGVFNQASVARSTYLGIKFAIQGEPRAGDRFSIRFNTDGVSDNRNARAIAALETKGILSNGVVTYGEAYSQVVEEIGTVTNRARLDKEAAKALLDQSVDFRESISGVNLDEEAGRLIQFQAAYNASSQVVAMARELFDTLLSTFR